MKENPNDYKPAGAEPVPASLVEKYRIGEVWWFAKGRDEDPFIGVEINGVRKTFSGYTYKDWWYFMKLVHPASDENEGARCYWYRKRKLRDPDDPEKFKISEEYVGANLHDPDSGSQIKIPQELLHDESDLCE